MSSGKKTLLVIATILVIGGGAISFGAFAAAGFNFENLSTESRNWTSSTKTFAPETENPHTAIVLRDMGEDVRIEPTDGDAIEVTYWTNERKSFDVDDNGGTVTVEGSREPAIDIMMIGSFEDHSTVLKVPRSYTGTLDIDLMGGNVDAADLDRLGSVTAKTASGNISLSRLAADDIVTNAARAGAARPVRIPERNHDERQHRILRRRGDRDREAGHGERRTAASRREHGDPRRPHG